MENKTAEIDVFELAEKLMASQNIEASVWLIKEYASQEREKGIIEGFNAAREKEDLKKIDEVDGGETWLNDCLKYKDSTDYLNSKK